MGQGLGEPPDRVLLDRGGTVGELEPLGAGVPQLTEPAVHLGAGLRGDGLADRLPVAPADDERSFPSLAGCSVVDRAFGVAALLRHLGTPTLGSARGDWFMEDGNQNGINLEITMDNGRRPRAKSGCNHGIYGPSSTSLDGRLATLNH